MCSKSADLGVELKARPATIRRAEVGGEQAARVTDGSVLVIERAFREAGVVFLEKDHASPGGGTGCGFRP